MIKARVLGYLLLHAPEEQGRQYLASEINSDQVDDQGNAVDNTELQDRYDETLRLLGKHHMETFIRCCAEFLTCQSPALPHVAMSSIC